MATRRLETRPEWEDALRSGLKTIDARLVADDIAGLEVGDVVQYPGAKARVRYIRFYPGFGDLLAHEDWRRIAPEASSGEDLRRLLEKGHSATVRQTGAVAIELEPVSDSVGSAPMKFANAPEPKFTMIAARPGYQLLLDRSRGEGMVVSCYADTSVAEGFERHWHQHLKDESTRIRGLLAADTNALREFERNLSTIKQVLESTESRHAAGMAIFSAEAWEQPLSFPSDEPYENQLVVDDEPYLVPLLVAEYLRREYMVVLTDTHRGRLYASSSGTARLIDELDEAVPKKNRSSGERWGKEQATIARHRKDHILRYQKELAQHVGKAWETDPYQGIILLGEHEVLENFRALLPKRLAARVVHEAAHSWAMNQSEIQDEVRRWVAAAIEDQQASLVATIESRVREGFAVATGPQEVIDALRTGQVAEVVLDSDAGEGASRCTNCRSIFAASRETCPYCKAPCALGNLWQEILTTAVKHNIAVHFVRSDAGRVVPGSVAALLTRDEPHWSAVAD
jgi:ASC-1-like (ASCH) protein